MTGAVLDIKQWGNSLGVRIPAAVAREAHLHVHQRVCVTVEGDQVVIKPFDESRLTLEQRVAAYDVTLHGGEQMIATEAIGAERW